MVAVSAQGGGLASGAGYYCTGAMAWVTIAQKNNCSPFHFHLLECWPPATLITILCACVAVTKTLQRLKQCR
jgi:hypothetical protein